MEGDPRHWMSSPPPATLPFLMVDMHTIDAHVATMAGSGATQVDVSAASMVAYDVRSAYRYDVLHYLAFADRMHASSGCARCWKAATRPPPPAPSAPPSALATRRPAPRCMPGGRGQSLPSCCCFRCQSACTIPRPTHLSRSSSNTYVVVY